MLFTPLKTFRKSLAARIKANRHRLHRQRKHRSTVNAIERLEDRTLLTVSVLIGDLNVGPESSSPGNFTAIDGGILFTADDGVNGLELWRADPDGSNPTLVKDLNPGPSGVATNFSLVEAGGVAYFVAVPMEGGRGSFDDVRLWRSDGTTAGTVTLSDVIPRLSHDAIVNIGGEIYFSARGLIDDGMGGGISTGYELWKSDGTDAGTVMVKDIVNGTGSSDPGLLTIINETVFFSADDGLNGWELWKSDGTAAGTVMVKDINLSGSSFASGLTNVNGTLYFQANDGINGRELWKSDGTAAGTVMVKNIHPTTSSDPGTLTNVNGILYFVADDGVNGRELWKSDGTAAGTVMVKDIHPSGSGITRSGQNFTSVGDVVYFSANDGVNGIEVWRSDGTEAGTWMVADINPGSGDSTESRIHDIAAVNGVIFFDATDGVSGTELWKTEGTAGTTALVDDIFAGNESSYPTFLTSVNGKLFFTAEDGTHGWEFWKVNDAPIAKAGQNQTLLERTLVTLNGSLSSDVNGDILTFAWVQTAGPTVTLSAPGAATTEFTAPAVLSRNTNLTFELTVTDSSITSDVDTITITVNPDLATDSDGDGIIDRIDTQPATFSNAFGDDKLYGDGQLVGGTSFGIITQRGDRTTFQITDNLNGGLSLDVPLGSQPFQLILCPGESTEITIDVAADKKLKAKNLECGSATVEVLEGEATMSTLTNGKTVSVAIDAGDLITFDETPTGELTVAQSGTGEIETTIDDQSFVVVLDSGESVTYTISTLGSVTVAAAGGEIDLKIDGSPIALPAGGTLATVGIDIKPGSFPNSINLGSNGSIPVAIFSTTEFDATTIDPLTVTLAEAQVRIRGKGTPMASKKDVNGDGLLDLVIHVETEGLLLSPADTQAQLVGKTFGGVTIAGSDSIRVVAALHVVGGPDTGVIVGDVLIDPMLDSAVEQAVAYWTTAGVEPHQIDVLTKLDMQIADLPDSLLGIAALNIVWIDRDAAGFGWSMGVESRELRVEGSGVDLFSTVTHEFGHVLGFEHADDGVMAETMAVRLRHLPGEEYAAEEIVVPVFSTAMMNSSIESTSNEALLGKLAVAPEQLFAEKYDYAVEANIETSIADDDFSSSEPVPYLPEEDLDADEFFGDFEGSLLDDLLAI